MQEVASGVAAAPKLLGTLSPPVRADDQGLYRAQALGHAEPRPAPRVLFRLFRACVRV